MNAVKALDTEEMRHKSALQLEEKKVVPIKMAEKRKSEKKTAAAKEAAKKEARKKVFIKPVGDGFEVEMGLVPEPEPESPDAPKSETPSP